MPSARRPLRERRPRECAASCEEGWEVHIGQERWREERRSVWQPNATIEAWLHRRCRDSPTGWRSAGAAVRVCHRKHRSRIPGLFDRRAGPSPCRQYRSPAAPPAPRMQNRRQRRRTGRRERPVRFVSGRRSFAFAQLGDSVPEPFRYFRLGHETPWFGRSVRENDGHLVGLRAEA